ncbi:MAG: hypothetical protein NVS4B5_21600 [Vulcanimicrobiaceae bacterium]
MVELRPWTDDEFPLLANTVGDAETMVHLGGAETAEQLARRHARYLAWSEIGGMYAIWLATETSAVGSIGLWASSWSGDDVFETGWAVLPAFTRRGIATAAACEIVRRARRSRERRFLFAFPDVRNVASNRVCAAAGFTNLGAYEIDYPPGRPMRAHAWRYDLIWDGAVPRAAERPTR